jgi:DNA-binding transcriptional regulator YiaG
MTGKQVRAKRRALGLTQDAFAKRVGVHHVTVSRWETEAVKVPEPVARLIRLLRRARRA